MSELSFQVPAALLYCCLATAGVLLWCGLVLRRRGVPRNRMAIILTLRLIFFFTLALLISRPVWTSPDPEEDTRKHIALLLDCSESMSVLEGDTSRYQQAVDFARETLLPMVDQSELQVQPFLFADSTQAVDGATLASANATGQATNLGQAIVQSIVTADTPPLAVIALTDGILTKTQDHNRAISVAVNRQVPLISVGFGSESGGRVMGIHDIKSPSIVEPGQKFKVTANVQATGEKLPSFDVLLLRDGQLVDRRRVESFDGPRTWNETFETVAAQDGVHTYEIKLMPPADDSVVISNSQMTNTVKSVSSKEIRVLYVQGGLTWDYKFVHIAMSKDPTIRLTGLSRTANASRFFESIQSDVDMINGFPNTLEKLSEFRVVVLSNLRPGDLTSNQQELLAKYCGQLGGGVLMIGGQQTFNASWRDSRLEDLLPVEFAVLSNNGGGPNFSVDVTPNALKHPIFQISDYVSTEEAWQNLPLFTNRAIVEDVKPGAEVWLESKGVTGNPVLMASQRYGNGLSSVICMQNFWRWRLSRTGEPRHFDRFWRQLFRYLADAGRNAIALNVVDTEPIPGDEIELLIEQAEVTGIPTGTESNDPTINEARLRVLGPNQKEVLDIAIKIEPGRPTSTRFMADESGMYSANLLLNDGTLIASRNIQVQEIAAELVSTSRKMELLRQFAAVSGGIAMEFEKTDELAAALKTFLQPEEQIEKQRTYALPAGMNGWILAFLLGCLSLDWLFRKRWQML
ncbi:hypothetical protein N9B98_03765 [bacterium]|nr:hypothetical protein [bacterium]